jgi:hypothetical protein
MWLIANGINIGLSSLIGEAVRNQVTELKRSRNKNSSSGSSGNSKLNFIGIADENLIRYGESIALSKHVIFLIENSIPLTIKC